MSALSKDCSRSPPTSLIPTLSGEELGKNTVTAILKEAELLRSEQLACISTVRAYARTSIIIAGASLPVLAGLLAYKLDSSGLQSAIAAGDPMTIIGQMIHLNGLLLELVCIGVAMVCAALFRIYVGVFKQIFNIAAYFREILYPRLDKILKSEDNPVMYWELWLRDRRAASAASFHQAGDADLYADLNVVYNYNICGDVCSIFTCSRWNIFLDWYIGFVNYVAHCFLLYEANNNNVTKSIQHAARAPRRSLEKGLLLFPPCLR